MFKINNIFEEDYILEYLETRNLVKQYKKLLELDGVELEFTREALEAIVDKAIERKTAEKTIAKEAIDNEAIDNEAIPATTAVTGIKLINPPSLLRSFVPVV